MQLLYGLFFLTNLNIQLVLHNRNIGYVMSLTIKI